MLPGESECDNATTNMLDTSDMSDQWDKELEMDLLYMHDPDTTDAERIQNIVDSKYKPADLQQVVGELTHLSNSERKQLLDLLNK